MKKNCIILNTERQKLIQLLVKTLKSLTVHKKTFCCDQIRKTNKKLRKIRQKLPKSGKHESNSIQQK